MLDFEKMRCIILYRGKLQPAALASCQVHHFVERKLLQQVAPSLTASLTAHLRKFLVDYAGQEMSGTDFERAAGREKAKKWKTSVRVLAEGGKQGEMIGDYLQVR